MTTRLTVAIAAALAIATSPVSADQTTTGIRVGAGVPATGMAGAFGPTFTLAGWISRPLRGSIGWRVEVGHDRQRLTGNLRSVCAGAGLACDARLGVTHVGGGFQFGPTAAQEIAPFGYITLGLYRVGASAAVDDPGGLLDVKVAAAENDIGFSVGGGFRFAITDRVGVFAEARYSGFTFGRNDTGWASLLTGAASLAFGF